MKLRTIGILLSAVFTITLSNTRHSAVANNLETAKEKVNGYVQEALVNQLDLKADELNPRKKGDEADESVYEIKLELSDIDEYIREPENYDYVEVSRALFANLGEREKREFIDFVRVESRLGTKEEKAFFKPQVDRAITREQYDTFIEEEFEEEINRQNRIGRAYYTNAPVYQNNQQSLTAALCAIMPYALVVTTVGCVVTAGATISIPIVGQAIAAAAILLLAAVYIIQWVIVGPIIAQIIRIVIDYIGKAAKAITNWFNQIVAKAWNTIINDAFNELKREFGNLLKWTKNLLNEALDKAINLAGALVTANYLKNNSKKYRVYLGRYNDTPNYIAYAASDPDGIAFSMDNGIYKNYERKGYNMWYLNQYFLRIVTSMGCEFRLCSFPDQYYHKGTSWVATGADGKPISYGRELKYIYNKGYRWNSYAPLPIPAYK